MKKFNFNIFNMPRDCANYFELIDFAAENGFEGIEPFPYWDLETPDIDTAKRIREKCDQLGLNIPCFSAFAFLGVEESEVERLKKYIEVTAALGAPYFHSTIIPFLDMSKVPPVESVMGTVVERVKIMCDHADKYGVGIVYEPQGMIFNGMDGMKMLFDAVGDQVALLHDVGNVYFVDEKPYDMAREMAPIIKHVHLKDYVYRTDKPADNMVDCYTSRGGNFIHSAKVGTGDIDFAKIFTILKDAGYTGKFSIESGGTKAGIIEAATALQKIYDEVYR